MSKNAPDRPICSNFARRPLCQTLSNAALMSKNRPWAILDLPQLDLIWWIRYINWVIVESPFKYAACLSVISSYLVQCDRSLSWIIDSQTFDKDGQMKLVYNLISNFWNQSVWKSESHGVFSIYLGNIQSQKCYWVS